METVALFSQDGGKWGFIKVKQMVRKLTYVLARNIKNTLSGDMGSFHDHDVPFAVCLVPNVFIWLCNGNMLNESDTYFRK